MLGQFLKTVEEHDMLASGSRVLAGVSGGADSVCLFDLLRSVVRTRSLWLGGFHLNHGLRKAAARDEAFVRRLFTDARLELVVVRADVRRYARRHGRSLEEAGRELRYRHLERVADRLGCDRIALGHNADDSLETMLLNLARGAGNRGLSGIAARRGRVIRPLIDVERARIVEYLQARRLTWIEDESNLDVTIRRNLIRHQAVAALRQVNPEAVRHARGAACRLEDEDRFLDALAAQALGLVLAKRNSRTVIDQARLRVYNDVLKRRMIRQLLPGLDALGVERALNFLGHSGSRAVYLTGRCRLLRIGGASNLVLVERGGRD